MLRRLFAKAAAAASLCLVLLPGAVSAQSSITGLVKDTTGAVLPGVTIETTSPALVDVQNAQRTTVLSRDLLDAIPVARMYQAEGALAVGTKVSDQNVGGARAAVNPRLTAHMSVTKDTTIDVDGMKMNTPVGGGDSHPDHNDAMSQEITVQTAALGAEVSAGGPHLNLIPREGGNTFSGAIYAGYTNGQKNLPFTGISFQSNNLTQDLIDRGLKTPDAVDLIYDTN